jgi:hypothetical protein
MSAIGRFVPSKWGYGEEHDGEENVGIAVEKNK